MQYIYEGAQALGEIRNGQLSHRLLTGLSLDETIARIAINSSGQKDNLSSRIYLNDVLNSVIAQLSDDNANPGQLQNSYAYSPYGEASTVGPDGTNNPNQYTSRENDGTGLNYYRARYYDPVLKQFLSDDPIGLVAGLNVRAYVGGNPLSYADPSGLKAGGGGTSTSSKECECSSSNGNSYWTDVWNNFSTTNTSIPGITLPGIAPGVGLGIITGGSMAQTLGSVTFLQWATGGFSTLAGYTTAETLVIITGSTAVNFAFATVAYETGVFAGSLINATRINKCGRTVRDLLSGN